MALEKINFTKTELPRGKTTFLLESFYPHSTPAEDLVHWPFNQQLRSTGNRKKIARRAD